MWAFSLLKLSCQFRGRSETYSIFAMDNRHGNIAMTRNRRDVVAPCIVSASILSVKKIHQPH